MATISVVLFQAFVSLCWSAAAKVQDFNALGIANTLWTMTTLSRVLLKAFDSLCWSAAAILFLAFDGAYGRRRVETDTGSLLAVTVIPSVQEFG